MKRGFTLVELLVAVSVIAILAGLLLGALYTAQDSARAQKTKSTIAKLHTALMARYEGYKTRRVPITIPPGTQPGPAAKLRLDALRELMRLEMPDRFSDITDAPAIVPVPSLAQQYTRKLPAGKTAQYQGAECLFLILTTSVTDDESGIESFGESEIKDVDGDGMREFVDAWGKPIRYLRWAPAFRSELQTGNQPDPYDSRGVYSGTFALYPLIYSPGPDGLYDIVSDLSPAMQYSAINNNPFDATVVSEIGKQADTPHDGTPADGELSFADNVTNHLIGTR